LIFVEILPQMSGFLPVCSGNECTLFPQSRRSWR
jgi:hypothetical protein